MHLERFRIREKDYDMGVRIEGSMSPVSPQTSTASLVSWTSYCNRKEKVLLISFFAIWLVGGTKSASGVCSDERDRIIKEYVTDKIPLVPQCSDFTRDAHSEHFSFKELNGGDFNWAILRPSLLKGIEETRANFGESLTVNSGYRNPFHNDTLRSQGSWPDSPHVHGNAADFQSSEGSWEKLKTAGKQAGACTEPESMSGSGHVHVDWRGGQCPVNW
jgi:peptidase M15-like protein